MTKKTKSEFFRTHPIRTDDGEEIFHFSNAKKRALPKSLREPLVVNMIKYRTYLDAQIKAGKSDINDIEREFYEAVFAQMRHRWSMLADIYGVQAHTLEGWRRLAIILATENIPGLQVEIIDTAKPAPRVRTNKNMQAFVDHVQTVAKEMQKKRTTKSTKVALKQVLKHVFNNWPPHLGKRRSTLSSLETHYHQCMKARPSMSLVDLGLRYKNERR